MEKYITPNIAVIDLETENAILAGSSSTEDLEYDGSDYGDIFE